jgi:hypothetical protein
MHLDLFHVDPLGADSHGHLVTVAGAVIAVGSGLNKGQSRPNPEQLSRKAKKRTKS